MSRAETTAMLSKLVEKRLKNQTAFWASEVNFDRNTPDNRRVDYVGFKPLNVNGEPVPAGFSRIDAFRIGVLGDQARCIKRFP